MYRRFLSAILVLATASTAVAQQFIGLTTNNYVAVNQLALNPAYVNNARTAPEVSLVAANALAGNNMYTIAGSWLLAGAKADIVEGKNLSKVYDDHTKRAWGNVDIMGPAVSFTYKKQIQLGVYTRFRVIANGGNIPGDVFKLWTNEKDPKAFNHTVSVEKVGASAQAFGEVGISIGKMIRDDEMHKFGVGVNIKYITGYAALNVYSKSFGYRRLEDSVMYATGDLAVMYTYNTTPNATGDLSQQAGKGGLALDIGAQYHYYPDGDPNVEQPYQFSLAASITDIGSVGYYGDAGSGKYSIDANKNLIHNYDFAEIDNNEFSYYLSRQTVDKVATQKSKADKFKIGLPTALRVNLDYNLGMNLYVSVNTLVNLRGTNGTIYKPAYTSYFNVTPRYDLYKSIKVGIPFTLQRYKDLTMGLIFYLGPLYVGSSTFISSFLINKELKQADVYTGLALRLVKRQRDYSRTYDNASDDPNRGLKKFIPRFLRSKEVRDMLCPPTR